MEGREDCDLLKTPPMIFSSSVPKRGLWCPGFPYVETIPVSLLPLAHIYIPGLDPTRGSSRVQPTAKLTQCLTCLFPAGSCHLGASCWENPSLSASWVPIFMNKWTFYQHCLEDADSVPNFRKYSYLSSVLYLELTEGCVFLLHQCALLLLVWKDDRC